jgi:hypothetical protein
MDGSDLMVSEGTLRVEAVQMKRGGDEVVEARRRFTACLSLLFVVGEAGKSSRQDQDDETTRWTVSGVKPSLLKHLGDLSCKHPG